ncbi:MAG: CBS domain-containing protein [Myxococcota bacterium]
MTAQFEGTVADIMTPDVVFIREEDNLESLRDAMETLHLRHLPVVDGDRLVGLLTHRDILRLTAGSLDDSPGAEERRSRASSGAFVATVMTRDVLTASPELSIGEAARRMVEGRFGCLPVVDAFGKLVGIVTEHDVLRWTVERASAPPPAPEPDTKKAPAEAAPVPPGVH